MEEMKQAGTTKMVAVESIEEIKGSCPNCGGDLEFRVFIDTWDPEHKPLDVNKDPYCSKCDLRWIAQCGVHDFYEE